MTIATVVTTTRHWWRVQLRKWTKHEQLLENGATEANGKGRELLSVGGWGCDCDLWWILASPMHWAAYHVSKWYYFLIEENFFWLNSTFSTQHGSSWTSAVTLPTPGAKFLNVTFSCPSKLLPPQTPCIRPHMEAVTHGSLDASSVLLDKYVNSMQCHALNGR
jgi:hypothetical protein